MAKFPYPQNPYPYIRASRSYESTLQYEKLASKDAP